MKPVFWLALVLAAVLASPARAAPLHAPCIEAGPSSVECDPVNSGNPMPVVVGTQAPGQYPLNSAPLTGAGAGSTGAVTATLTSLASNTTYLCGFTVNAVGGTAAVGPITVAGILGGSLIYQMTSSATGAVLTQNYSPCIPANALNTNITITTTADGTATAVDVNAWGFNFIGTTPYLFASVVGAGAGTTGAVVSTLAGAALKTTYICGFSVGAFGGAATVGPITVAGTITSSLVYQLFSTATGSNLVQSFTPCIPASAPNTAITVTTTADGTATAVDVNSWGFRQ